MTQELVAISESDTVWTGRLYRTDADPKYDDPVWTCDHKHETEEEAEKCAIRESWRLGLKSQFARMAFLDAGTEADRDVLARLDETFLFAEEHYGELGDMVVTGICNRFRHVYQSGMADCMLPHPVPAGRSTFIIKKGPKSGGHQAIMRTTGDEQVEFLVVPSPYVIDTLSAIRMAYERGQLERPVAGEAS